VEIVEGGDSSLDGAIKVLQRAKTDADAVLRALRIAKYFYMRKWECPDCGRVVECSYEQLVESGNPYCSDCDMEMEIS